jgi:hypothetical protein
VTNTSPGLVVATYDGVTFSTVYHDTTGISGGADYSGAIATMGPTSSGKVIGYWNNPQRFANGSILTGYLPTQAVDRTALGSVRSILQTGWYYAPPCGTTPLTYSQGVMRASPFYLPEATVIDRIGVNVQTSGESGAKLRLGLYADSGLGVPGALIVDGGQVAADSTGYKEVTIAETAGPGVIWLTVVPQSCATTPPAVWGNTYDGLSPIGSTSAGLISANGLSSFECTSFVTAALPASFGNVNGGSGGPRAIIRVA